MRIRKGDNVKIVSGSHRGKIGKVIQAFPDTGKVVVDGVRMTAKHLRARKSGEKGQKLEFAAPFTASNVMLVCPKCDKPTRVGVKLLTGEGGAKKVRSCKRCGEAVS